MMHNYYMSTRLTISLSDEAEALVTEYAESLHVSKSKAASDLIERSVPRKLRVKIVNGLALFDFPVKGGKITTEDVRRLEDEPW
jgi:predicted transcriptional regulator